MTEVSKNCRKFSSKFSILTLQILVQSQSPCTLPSLQDWHPTHSFLDSIEQERSKPTVTLPKLSLPDFCRFDSARSFPGTGNSLYHCWALNSPGSKHLVFLMSYWVKRWSFPFHCFCLTSGKEEKLIEISKAFLITGGSTVPISYQTYRHNFFCQYAAENLNELHNKTNMT